MSTVNAITGALQGGPLGVVVGFGVAFTLLLCALGIAKACGTFNSDRD